MVTVKAESVKQNEFIGLSTIQIGQSFVQNFGQKFFFGQNFGQSTKIYNAALIT